MASIRLLEESIAQKIAAGEVVERPASVIKELAENSVDAGSTFITVEIREGGIEHMRVTDNGCGIPAAEVELAFLRHATSKIQSLEDLYNIRQMGFRGEALYSIAAVSRLELTTKPAEQPSGIRLAIDGGKRMSLADYGCPDGTTITANDLFFNTPARLKFLNKPGIESSYVGTVVMRLILANPGISIKFVNNDKVLYQSPGDGSLKNAIYAVFGREIAQGLVPVSLGEGDLGISGYLFAPDAARGNRGYQVLMVNGRPVIHTAISAIVERLYAGLTDTRRFPGYVLSLSLKPGDVDVNVHPNKLQVRFADEFHVKLAVESAVSAALERFKGQPLQWAFPAEESRPAANEGRGEAGIGSRPENKTEGTFSIRTIDETVGQLKESVRQAMTHAFGSAGDTPQPVTLMQRPSIPNIAYTQQPIEQTAFAGKPAARMIGQVFSTYALLEFEDRLLIIDQHAAHERLLYDRYVRVMQGDTAPSQKLLIPQVLNVSHEIKAVLDGSLELLATLGFELEEYGKLSFRVNTVPHILGQPQMQDILFEIVEILSDDRAVRTDELKREKIMSMACKRAVKAGDTLSTTELAALMELIAAEDTPLTCPHGRPFVIVLDKHSMEKQFRRVK